jgi:ornithine carbamoyltransferase
MSPRHFLDLSALPKADVRAVLDEGHKRKAARKGWPKAKRDADAPLDGHALAMIFQKNSTRTRVSFEIGMAQLGGVGIVLNAADTQLGRGETVEDTARVLSRMVDCVMIRANNHQDVVDFAAVSDAPVINGLTDLSHPADGAGYRFVADFILEIDQANPQLAARLLSAFRSWRVLEPVRRAAAQAELQRIAGHEGLSRDTADIVQRSLA